MEAEWGLGVLQALWRGAIARRGYQVLEQQRQCLNFAVPGKSRNRHCRWIDVIVIVTVTVTVNQCRCQRQRG